LEDDLRCDTIAPTGDGNVWQSRPLDHTDIARREAARHPCIRPHPAESGGGCGLYDAGRQSADQSFVRRSFASRVWLGVDVRYAGELQSFRRIDRRGLLIEPIAGLGADGEPEQGAHVWIASQPSAHAFPLSSQTVTASAR